jgi:hypothetical protein
VVYNISGTIGPQRIKDVLFHLWYIISYKLNLDPLVFLMMLILLWDEVDGPVG